MARFDTFSDSQLEKLVPSATRLLSLVNSNFRNTLGGVPNLEIGQAVAIWMLADGPIARRDLPMGKVAIFTHRWMHLLRDKNTETFLGDAVSSEDEPGSPAEVVSASASPDQAQVFAAASTFIRNTAPNEDYVARYLIVPSYQTRAIWLEAQEPVAADQQSLIVVCDSPPAFGLERVRYYKDLEFRELLSASRSITGLVAPPPP
jgi:hypothetical protein